jgi:hypothetical protein
MSSRPYESETLKRLRQGQPFLLIITTAMWVLLVLVERITTVEPVARPAIKIVYAVTIVATAANILAFFWKRILIKKEKGH